MESRLQEMEARLAPLKVKVDQRETGFVELRRQPSLNHQTIAVHGDR